MKRRAAVITSSAVAVAVLSVAIVASGASIAVGDSQPPEVLTFTSSSAIEDVAESLESASISYDSVGVSLDSEILEIVVSYQADVAEATSIAEELETGLTVEVSVVEFGPGTGKLLLENGHKVTVPLLMVP